MDTHPTSGTYLPSDHSDPYFDADHPDHASAVAEVQARFRAESSEPSQAPASSTPFRTPDPILRAVQARRHALAEEDDAPAPRTPDGESPKPTDDALAPYKPESVELPPLPAEHEWDQAGLGQYATFTQHLGLNHGQASGLLQWYGAWGPKLDDPDLGPRAQAAFEQEAARLGLTPDQARQVLDFHAQSHDLTRDTTPSDAALSTLHALRTEWGSQFDDRLARAKTAVRSLGGADIVGILEETGLGDDPRVVKMFERVGALLDRDRVGGSDASAPVEASTLSRESAERLIRSILDDDKSPYYDAASPRHHATVEHVKRLYKRAYPA